MVGRGEVADEDAADQADGVSFEDIGRHPGAVADVIADVVRDGGGVARIIFLEVLLDFSDQIRADVGGLGVNAAAEAGEDADQGTAKGEADQGVDGGRAVVTGELEDQQVETADREQTERDDQQTGDRAAVECDPQGRVGTDRCGLGGADVRPDRDHHADVASGQRADRPDDEAAGSGPVAQHADGDEHQQGDD